VLYSHRSTVLHTYAGGAARRAELLAARRHPAGGADVPRQRLGPALCGLHGGRQAGVTRPGLDGKSLYELFESEGVTLSAGVPTVWQGLLAYVQGQQACVQHHEAHGDRRLGLPAGHDPRLQEKYGVHVLHAWGMTEMSPLGTVCTFKAKHLPQCRKSAMRDGQAGPRHLRRGHEDRRREDGTELPWDGEASGDLLVRGPWIMAATSRARAATRCRTAGSPPATWPSIDADGYMQITDRSKDVIKSGGEWIGSIDLENIAMAHPAVAMAACIAAKHPKWDERPLLVVVKKPGAEVTKEELLAFFEGKIAKWWTPDDVVFVDAIPLGATGKMQKNKLRDGSSNPGRLHKLGVPRPDKERVACPRPNHCSARPRCGMCLANRATRCAPRSATWARCCWPACWR
jgi:acyl-CoA synthetase (AMP-forming)/AMP-acid ligase II